GAAPSPTPPSTLSLHDALPISTRAPDSGLTPNGCADKVGCRRKPVRRAPSHRWDMGQSEDAASTVDEAEERRLIDRSAAGDQERSEEHTSELQSLRHLVCRLLL